MPGFVYNPKLSREEIVCGLMTNMYPFKYGLEKVPGVPKLMLMNWNNNITSAIELYDYMNSNQDPKIRAGYTELLRKNYFAWLLPDDCDPVIPAPIVTTPPVYTYTQPAFQSVQTYSGYTPTPKIRYYKPNIGYNEVVVAVKPHVIEISRYLVDTNILLHHIVMSWENDIPGATKLYDMAEGRLCDPNFVTRYKEALAIYGIDCLLAEPLPAPAGYKAIQAAQPTREVYLGKCANCPKQRKIVYFPCGHCTTCEDCSPQSSCPKCGIFTCDYVSLCLA